MPARDYDESLWETTDGLGLNHENATITAMQFRYDNKILPDQIFAKVTFTPEGGGEPREEAYSVGKGDYKISEGGDLLETEVGDPPKPNRTTKWGRFIDAVKALGAGPDIGDPFYGPGWVGTQWKVYRLEDDFTPKGGGDKVKFSIVLPEAYNGRVEAKKATKARKAAAPKTEAEEVDAVTEAASEGDGPITAKLRAQLVALAAEAVDEDGFQEAAWELLPVKKSTEIQNYILTADGLYDELKAAA